MRKKMSNMWIVMLTLLLMCVLTPVFDFYSLEATPETIIYIKADGSVDPSDAPIQRDGNIYTFIGNIVYPTYRGIVVEKSGITIDGNGYTLRGLEDSGTGFDLTGVNGVDIKRTFIEDFFVGIWLNSSSSNTIWQNTITDCTYAGVILVESSNNNAILGNTITMSYTAPLRWGGILLYWSSSDNVVSGNTIMNYSYGIELTLSCNYNLISGNTMTRIKRGVSVKSCSNNTIARNTITNCWSYGIGLIDCLNSTVSGNTIADIPSYTGGEVAIGFNNSSLNIVSGNSITNASGLGGVGLGHFATYNRISGNNITTSTYGLLFFNNSNCNTIYGNNIANNDNGVCLEFETSNNTFYHNNFIDNNLQVNITSSDCLNTWDDGYPSGGNYWSDYIGVDLYCGPYQNETGSDGIGDTPYLINENNTDNYPFLSACTLPYDVTMAAYCDTEEGYVSVPIAMYGSPTPYTTPHTFTGLIGTYNFTVPDSDSNGHPFWLWNTGETSTTITVTSGGTYTAYYSAGHDVAVTNVTVPKTLVGQGYCINITVTVENQGNHTETFGVVAPYFSGAVIPTSAQWKTFWSMGDVNLDGYINLIDIDIIGYNYMWIGPPGENPADINSDGIVDAFDLGRCIGNQGKNIWTYFGLPLPPIGTQRGVKLHPNNQTTLTFTWDTTGFAKGNYTITAYATRVPGETDTPDNTFTNGVVTVTMAGDLNADGIVDIFDLVIVAAEFGRPDDPPIPITDHRADITNDGIVDIFDLVVVAANFPP